MALRKNVNYVFVPEVPAVEAEDDLFTCPDPRTGCYTPCPPEWDDCDTCPPAPGGEAGGGGAPPPPPGSGGGPQPPTPGCIIEISTVRVWCVRHDEQGPIDPATGEPPCLEYAIDPIYTEVCP